MKPSSFSRSSVKLYNVLLDQQGLASTATNLSPEAFPLTYIRVLWVSVAVVVVVVAVVAFAACVGPEDGQ